MNPNQPGNNADLAARIELHHRRIHKSVATRITELSDGGLSVFEIQATTGLALPLIRLVLRGATLGVTK
jgi:hypothetical protein